MKELLWYILINMKFHGIYLVDQFSVLPRIFLRSSGEWGGAGQALGQGGWRNVRDYYFI